MAARMAISSEATSRGQTAIVEAVRVPGTAGRRRAPRSPAGVLARAGGLADEHHARMRADLPALNDAGGVRLISGGTASGRGFYEATLGRRA
jgi:hypothetical protein